MNLLSSEYVWVLPLLVSQKGFIGIKVELAMASEDSTAVLEMKIPKCLSRKHLFARLVGAFVLSDAVDFLEVLVKVLPSVEVLIVHLQASSANQHRAAEPVMDLFCEFDIVVLLAQMFLETFLRIELLQTYKLQTSNLVAHIVLGLDVVCRHFNIDFYFSGVHFIKSN